MVQIRALVLSFLIITILLFSACGGETTVTSTVVQTQTETQTITQVNTTTLPAQTITETATATITNTTTSTITINPQPTTTTTTTTQTSTTGEITRTGHITEDETWSGTVHVTGEIFIDEGVTLTVSPGTTVLFAAHQDDQHFGAAVPIDEWIAQNNDPTWTQEYAESHITIRGKIIAQGTPEDMITFTSDSQTPDAGDWLQLHPSAGSTFEYCVIEYSRGGIGLPDTAGDILISHNIFRHNLWTALTITSGSPTVTYNDIYHSGGHQGIAVIGENNTPLIAYNQIKECKVGMVISESASPAIENNVITDNDAAAIGLIRAGESTIIRYNQISSPNGPSMHFTYQDEIIYPSNRLQGEEWVSEGISINNSSPTIFNNNIFQCNNIGVVLLGDSSPNINYNTIEGHNIGILFEESFVGTPTIEMNNIFNNENSNIALRFDGNVDVRNNWWGTTDPEEIQEKIRAQGEPAIGRAEFEPFLTEPVDIT